MAERPVTGTVLQAVMIMERHKMPHPTQNCVCLVIIDQGLFNRSGNYNIEKLQADL